MKATIWSDEFRKLCEPKSDEQFEKIVRHVDAYASEYLAQNNSYLSGRVDTLYKDLEIAKAENAGLKAALRAQPEAPALTDDFAKIREVLSWHDHERDDLTLDDVIDVIRHGYVKVRGRTDRAMFLQIAALLSAPAQAAVEPNDDTATLWARIHHLEAELKGPDDFATWKDAAVAERLRRVKAERKATDDALAIRDAALEDAAIMLENGIFLHDDSPAKRLAKEAAAAIRRMKSQVQKPLSKAERIAELQAELAAHLAEDEAPQPAQDAVERDHWKPNDAQAAIIRDIAMEEIAYRQQPAQGIAQPVVEPSFTERDPNKPAEQQGLFRKFEVHRVDGSDKAGGKHEGCRYFVLDLDHDNHAHAAMHAYANDCAKTHPALSADLIAEFGAQPVAEVGERELFEKSLRDNHPYLNLDRKGHTYESAYAHYAWSAWETRAALAQSPAVQEPWGWAIRGTILPESWKMYVASEPNDRDSYEYMRDYRYKESEVVYEIKELYAAPAPAIPPGWCVAELESIFIAQIGSPITADMKRSAGIALKVVRGERWVNEEWVAPQSTVSQEKS